MPKHRAPSEADAAGLRAAGALARAHAQALLQLAERDSAAYDAVVRAYRLPKDTDDARAARALQIQAAMRDAVETPLEVMRRAWEAIDAAVVAAGLGHANASSDVGVGIELLLAAARGARLNVAINLPSLTDRTYAGRAEAEAGALMARCEAAAAAARAALRPGRA
jgi:formiminotetrahydrofolate cyclodeaminase